MDEGTTKEADWEELKKKYQRNIQYYSCRKEERTHVLILAPVWKSKALRSVGINASSRVILYRAHLSGSKKKFDKNKNEKNRSQQERQQRRRLGENYP